jgi:hypothetical protein
VNASHLNSGPSTWSKVYRPASTVNKIATGNIQIAGVLNGRVSRTLGALRGSDGKNGFGRRRQLLLSGS